VEMQSNCVWECEAPAELRVARPIQLSGRLGLPAHSNAITLIGNAAILTQSRGAGIVSHSFTF
jgi:hypothetical protein